MIVVTNKSAKQPETDLIDEVLAEFPESMPTNLITIDKYWVDPAPNQQTSYRQSVSLTDKKIITELTKKILGNRSVSLISENNPSLPYYFITFYTSGKTMHCYKLEGNMLIGDMCNFRLNDEKISELLNTLLTTAPIHSKTVSDITYWFFQDPEKTLLWDNAINEIHDCLTQFCDDNHLKLIENPEIVFNILNYSITTFTLQNHQAHRALTNEGKAVLIIFKNDNPREVIAQFTLEYGDKGHFPDNKSLFNYNEETKEWYYRADLAPTKQETYSIGHKGLLDDKGREYDFEMIMKDIADWAGMHCVNLCDHQEWLEQLFNYEKVIISSGEHKHTAEIQSIHGQDKIVFNGDPLDFIPIATK